MFQSFGGWFCIIVLGLVISIALSDFKVNSWKVRVCVWVSLIFIFQADYYVGYFKYRSLCDSKAGVRFVKQAVMPAGVELKAVSGPDRAQKYLDMGFGYVRGDDGVIFMGDKVDVLVDKGSELTSWTTMKLLGGNIYEYRLGWDIGSERIYEQVSYSYSGGWIDELFSSYSLNYIEGCNPEPSVSYSLIFEGIQ